MLIFAYVTSISIDAPTLVLEDGSPDAPIQQCVEWRTHLTTGSIVCYYVG